MKATTRVTLVLSVFLVIIALSCNNSGKQSLKKESAAVLTMEVSISGMSCAGCEQTVQNSLTKIEGIKSVKAMSSVGKAYVEYSSSLSDTTIIRSAITGAGYMVTGMLIIPVTVADSPK